MATTFSCPAQYRRVVEAAIATTLSTIARDAKWRADDDPVTNKLAPIDEYLIDPAETGTLLIMVSVPNEDARKALPENLNAASPLTRDSHAHH